jgi:hypothetical protein
MKIEMVRFLAVLFGILFSACTATVRTVPPVRTEVIPVAPSARHVWVPGRYVWRGGYVWQPGFYQVVPRGRATYVPGYWRPAGRRYVWVPGRWR